MSGSASFQRVRKSLIRGAGFGRVTLHGVGAGEAGGGLAHPTGVRHQSSMFYDFLEFGNGLGP
jgi:hypothetical protein